ncbi:hypothetical protein LUZ61_000003 [Rhynchospora tenuis]|uniref:Ankyrin n=1 Tax=Rhynchospora tenuis TaxID=198213 RepID=A0AAD6EPF0_9POAL|nr:hypothetical protein LUZ61_021068 [Rhynchospora tenuis]KAJ3696298.1 hypothetical protein LUZ61_000003 [Rhynchospora tenuis]
MRGHVATARYLISQGANTVAPNGEGWTPLHYAARYGQDELVKHLLSLGVPVDVTCNPAVGAPLIVAALFGQASTVEVLLQHHADPNGASTDYTPLLSSIHAGSLECTKILIKAGADLNLKYPLDMAIHEGLNDIINCLLEAGADPNVRNAEYEKASQAFMDGLLLDPNNIEIKKAYWEAVDCLRRLHLAETGE